MNFGSGHGETEAPLYRAGCDGQVLSDFRLLRESGRYASGGDLGAERSALGRLAGFLAGTSGQRRDWPLFELCYLVAALAAVGIASEGERVALFLGLERVTPRRIRAEIEMLAGDVDDDGLSHGDGDNRFTVRYGRMPFLFALFEFLACMDGGVFYHQLNDTLDEMVQAGSERKAVQAAANAIARRVRDYRRAHLDWAANDETYTALSQFLTANGDEGRWRIDDAAVLAFWQEQSRQGRFREYRTAFDAVARLMDSLDRAARTREAETGATLGADWEAGEVDPAEDADDLSGAGFWRDPLAVFDDDALKGINFFKGASERKPLENLMRHGPSALRLAHAFLRLEAFAPEQTALGNDLRVGRGTESVKRHIALDGAVPYPEKTVEFEGLEGHVANLLKASLHVLVQGGYDPGALFEAARGDDEFEASPEAIAAVLEEARRAHDAIKRRGFAGADPDDEERRDAFALAADALVRIAGQLRAFLDRARGLDGQAGLGSLFEADKAVFRDQFQTLYGDRL